MLESQEWQSVWAASSVLFSFRGEALHNDRMACVDGSPQRKASLLRFVR